jgi:hypothetical protein
MQCAGALIGIDRSEVECAVEAASTTYVVLLDNGGVTHGKLSGRTGRSFAAGSGGGTSGARGRSLRAIAHSGMMEARPLALGGSRA